MPLITINKQAHDALISASPTIKTEGSMQSGTNFVLNIDEETFLMLDAKSFEIGADNLSEVIIHTMKGGTSK